MQMACALRRRDIFVVVNLYVIIVVLSILHPYINEKGGVPGGNYLVIFNEFVPIMQWMHIVLVQ